jgi:hypothetical protein
MATLLAMALALPSLGVGRQADDLLHQLKMQGSSRYPEIAAPSFDLFMFLDGDPAHNMKLIDMGDAPWWTYPELKASFWRPVTVLTHRFDYWLWPDLAVLMHVHSILWYGAAVFLVALLYRRMMGATWIAGLAALFFAIDDAHGMPVGFLANRNTLIAVVFGVLTLICHDRWRRDGWRPGSVLGPVFLALSLLSKEAGVAVAAFLLAYAVFIDPSSRWRSLSALWCHAALIVIWRVVWICLGHGLWGMGPYVDPVAEPLRFLDLFVLRAPILLLGQWALPPSDVAVIVGDEGRRVLWWVAVVFLIVLVAVMFPVVRRDRLARFWFVGMVLSIFPPCTTFLSDRTLFFVGLGAMGLLARFFGVVRVPVADRPVRVAWRIPAQVLLGLFVFVHGVVAPIMLAARASSPIGAKGFLEQCLVLTPMDESVENQDVIIVNAPIVMHALYMSIIRELNGLPIPRRTRSLAPGFTGVTYDRPDERTLVARPNGGFLGWEADTLMRGLHLPMPLGHRVELTGLTIEVTELTDDGRPAAVTFTFDVPLEDPSLRWLRWCEGEFVPFTPPRIGESVELAPAVPDFWGRRGLAKPRDDAD